MATYIPHPSLIGQPHLLPLPPAAALALALAVVVCPPAGAAPTEAPLDLDSFPGEIVDEVVVPVPAEVLAILGKLGETGWAAEQRPTTRPRLRGRIDYALALGVAVADGFVAVQAMDGAGVEAAGRAVLARAEALGLRGAVTRHCQAIFDAVEADDWSAVRSELDRTEATARATMEKMGDGELATCVSLGGWVRGTEVASGVIVKAYTSDKAELLNQPDLVKHFVKSVGSIKASVSDSTKLVAVRAALDKIAGLMGDGKMSVPSDAVVRINEHSARVVDLILGVAPKEDGGAGG